MRPGVDRSVWRGVRWALLPSLLFWALLFWALDLFKPNTEECVVRVSGSWFEELEYVPTLDQREAIESMSREACEGLARDGVVRK